VKIHVHRVRNVVISVKLFAELVHCEIGIGKNEWQSRLATFPDFRALATISETELYWS